MQFVLFDFSATAVFLFGYLAVVALQRRRVVPLAIAADGALSREPRPVPSPERRKSPEGGKSVAVGKEGPTSRPRRREWPRLSHPR